MRALSIRQPFAELILRGIKTVEYRSIATKIVGERFHIYASKTPIDRKIWSRDLEMPKDLPLWMLELAQQVKLIPQDSQLPTGVIVGSAIIDKVEEVGGSGLEVGGRSLQPTTHNPRPTLYRWHLTDVQRATTLRKPINHPQPVWFRPF